LRWRIEEYDFAQILDKGPDPMFSSCTARVLFVYIRILECFSSFPLEICTCVLHSISIILMAHSPNTKFHHFLKSVHIVVNYALTSPSHFRHRFGIQETKSMKFDSVSFPRIFVISKVLLLHHSPLSTTVSSELSHGALHCQMSVRVQCQVCLISV
jgi:hypothetical protein